MIDFATLRSIRERWTAAMPVLPEVAVQRSGPITADLVYKRSTGSTVCWADLPVPAVRAMAAAKADVTFLLAAVEELAAQLAHDREVRLHQEKG